MIRWALRLVVKRIALTAAFLLAVHALLQSLGGQYADSRGVVRMLAGLPEALGTLSSAFR